ncbi:MAG: OsmC family protein [Gemmatimonadales bacterium]|nr:OsmC family protein [Gemmatimonadales bacterium]
MDRTASARWNGDLKGGKGTLKVGSGAFEGSYSFTSRFEGGGGTNPEELLGAAHAGCFSMALSHALAQAGKVPTSVETTATVHLGKVAAGFAITGIDLKTRGVVPGLSADEFRRFAEDTKANCIVSKALAAVPMTLDAALA